jgi:hypothetical protein
LDDSFKLELNTSHPFFRFWYLFCDPSLLRLHLRLHLHLRQTKQTLPEMGLVHVPRVIASVAKGFYRKGIDKSVGFGLDNPHIYQARAGLFDVDSFGHVNNAAYLTHAELARWEHSASNGLLNQMYNHGVGFYAVSTAVRYRRQIRPVFRKFQVDTTIAGIDDRNLWV